MCTRAFLYKVTAVNLGRARPLVKRWWVPAWLAAVQTSASPRGARPLVSADDLEVLVDEDVVRPVDADVVDLVLAVAQLHNTVDDTPRVSGQRSFRRLIRCRSAGERPGPLSVVRRDLTDRL